VPIQTRATFETGVRRWLAGPAQRRHLTPTQGAQPQVLSLL
jgi:hypothetical protein